MLRVGVIVAMAVWPALVQAQDDAACLEEVRELFSGPLDPFNRPAHTMTQTVMSPDGDLVRVSDTITETPLRQVSGVRDSGQYVLMIDRAAWMGETMDGPWNSMGQMMTDDMVAAQHQVPVSMAANLSETECPGLVETEAGTRLVYRFRTRVDPHPARGDSWWGSLDEVWLDPETRLPLRWIQTEHISSWREGTNMERHISVIRYDDTLTVPVPE